MLLPGMLVSAEVKKSSRIGVVVGRPAAPPGGEVKEIFRVVSDAPVFSRPLLELLNWMARYYITPAGLALKGMGLMDYIAPRKKVSRRVNHEKAPPVPKEPPLPPAAPEVTKIVSAAVARGEYRTFLMTAPTFHHEISNLLAVLNGLSNAIVLVPELSLLKHVEPFFQDAFGGRLSVIHGDLSGGSRREALGRIRSGSADIVLGTRLAVFAPLARVSLLAVLQEQSQSYKNLEGVRYHGRDLAVMRGFLENAPVLLSAAVPSVESYYNTQKGKYTPLHVPSTGRRPRVEVINMRTSRTATPYLSGRALQSAAACAAQDRGAIFFINRKGYSLIQCPVCGSVEACRTCGIPLVLHRDKKVLRCRYCRYSIPAPDLCSKCSSPRLENVGAGTQRIVADLKERLGIEPVRIDRDALREDPALDIAAEPAGSGGIIVGTKVLSGRLGTAYAARLCVLVNPDLRLHLPDFRAPELLFQEIAGLSRLVQADGTIIIQTRLPEHDVYTHTRRHDIAGFLDSELNRRRSLAYPPFSRIIAIAAAAKEDPSPLVKAVLPPAGNIEVIGPIRLQRTGSQACKVILKSVDREGLHAYAANVAERLREEKGLRLAVDVDPIEL